MKRDYKKDDLVVHWNSESCFHSGKCVKNLYKVFNPKARPWINVDGGTKQEIINAIEKCPSGALSYSLENAVPKSNNMMNESEKPSITIVHNGPARVKGSVVLIDKDGNETIKEGVFSLCRCGMSDKKPLCDGSHKNMTPPLDE